MRLNEFEKSDYEIHDRPKLDRILLELCHRVIQGKQDDPIKYGMVAACVLDPKNRKVFGVNEAAEDGKRRHAERVAMDRYVKHYGDIPEGSIIITTLSPCNEDDTEMAAGRYGESCTDLVNNSNVRKVYCGYLDPSQHEAHAEYTLEDTSNNDIKMLCKKFADTFLDSDEEKLSELDVSKTLNFATKAHSKQQYGDKPYITHPRSVAATGKQFFGAAFTPDAIKVALLHDVVEDTPYKLNQLSKMGYSPQVVQAVQLLTKNKNLSYADNIRAIIASGNKLAMMVKYADNYQNFTGDKSSWDPARAAHSQKKYLASLNMLGDKLGIKKHL